MPEQDFALERIFTMGLPQLDVHTLSEDWALANALEQQWMILSENIGKKPSEWIDSQGDRMYGAVLYLSTWFDLDNIVGEDDEVVARTELTAIRKPHSLATTNYIVDNQPRASVTILTSFIKRHTKGSNKKFSKVRDLWVDEDFNADSVETLLEEHHHRKEDEVCGEEADRIEINRIRDFNVADFMYFKNYVRIAKAAEWRFHRDAGTYLNMKRSVFFYGNVEDGDVIRCFVGTNKQGQLQSVNVTKDGRRISQSLSEVRPVEIRER